MNLIQRKNNIFFLFQSVGCFHNLETIMVISLSAVVCRWCHRPLAWSTCPATAWKWCLNISFTARMSPTSTWDTTLWASRGLGGFSIFPGNWTSFCHTAENVFCWHHSLLSALCFIALKTHLLLIETNFMMQACRFFSFILIGSNLLQFLVVSLCVISVCVCNLWNSIGG